MPHKSSIGIRAAWLQHRANPCTQRLQHTTGTQHADGKALSTSQAAAPHACPSPLIVSRFPVVMQIQVGCAAHHLCPHRWQAPLPTPVPWHGLPVVRGRGLQATLRCAPDAYAASPSAEESTQLERAMLQRVAPTIDATVHEPPPHTAVGVHTAWLACHAPYRHPVMLRSRL